MQTQKHTHTHFSSAAFRPPRPHVAAAETAGSRPSSRERPGHREARREVGPARHAGKSGPQRPGGHTENTSII